ncbi:NAD(P)/FAD-dependent oxidoreductase [Thermodesulfovibrionales bacterium]|nr:NAD(P)/FAD-dependent oxidoreductase [Thermodesulfovibrionales bacterium]
MRVLVLGGGSVGTMFANRMRKAFSKDEVEIIVLERSEKHIYQPAFTLLVFDLEDQKNIIRPTKDLFFEGINLIIDEATKIDPQNNKVATKRHGEISYDYLVIATGATFNLDEPEGIKEGLEKGKNIFSFYDMEGALKLGKALKDIDGGTIVSSLCDLPIKCPAAPIKFILMAEDMMRARGIRDKFKFVLTSPLPQAFSREPYASKIDEICRRRGVEVVSNFSPGEVDHEKGVLRDHSGKEVEFDLLSLVPSHEGENVVQGSEDVGDAVGWVSCDKHHMVNRTFSNIYGIGDASDFPTSKTASGARKQAAILTERMKEIVRGEKPAATYDGHIICPILTRDKRVIFAEFNYTESISPSLESYVNWVVKVYMLRSLYFNLMLPGLV